MGPTSIKDDKGFVGLFPVGTLIHSRYEILSEGKMGGMGMVYRCRDTRHAMPREIALKLMQPKYLDSKDAVERFRHEASISRDLLHHQNIVRVYHDDEWHDDNGVVWYYLLMEWIEGKNLRDLINERKRVKRPFSLTEAYRIVSQLAAALTYAHNHKEKVIHRDVKPENILITDEAALSLKLADFGIAKILNLEELAQNSTPLGISPYMSPELKAGEADVDQRTDIYSVGVVLYELFTLDSTIGPYCPSELNPAVPKDLDGIYKRAVAPRTEQRYQTMKALSEGLYLEVEKERFSGGLPRKGESPKESEAGPAERPERRRPVKGFIVALIIALVLAGGVAAFMVYQTGQEEAAARTRIAAQRQQEKEVRERQELEAKKREAEAEREREREEKERQAKESAKIAPLSPSKPADKAKISTPKAAWKPPKPPRFKKPADVASLPRSKVPDDEFVPVTSKPAPEPPRPPKQDQEEARARQGAYGAPEGVPQPPLQGAIPASPGSAEEDHFYKGLRFIKSRQFLQAVTEFARTLEINPRHELASYWRGVAYYRLGNYGRAADDFTGALSLKTHDLYYHWRGATYYRLNNCQRAIDDFTRAIRIRPNGLDYQWRGTCYHKMGKYLEAEADFAMANRYKGGNKAIPQP
jgi:serine/threonine protein kinase